MDSHAPRRCDAVWSAPLFFFILGSLFLTIPLIHAASKPNCSGNKDYTFWYEIGRDVRADLPLYRPMFTGELKYMYPPTLAVLIYAPLTHLGPIGFVAALGTLTSLAWVASIWASVILIAGRWPGHPRWLYALPGLAVVTYVWDIQLLGQINLILLALTLLSMVALSRGRWLAAGTLLGLAAAMKAFPITAVVYFAFRREWRATAVTLIAVAGFTWFLPAVFRGFERTNAELQQWAGHMVADQSGNTIAARPGIAFTRRNHSLVSVSHRLLRPVDAGDNPKKFLAVNVADVSPRTAQMIGYAAVLSLGTVLLLSTRLRFASSPRAEGLEISMVCLLVILCSPLSFTYFYCWLLPAWTAVAFLWNDSALNAWSRTIVRFGAAIAGMFLVSSLSEQFDPTLQALGVTTWGTMSLFLILAFARLQMPNGQAQFVAMPLAQAA